MRRASLSVVTALFGAAVFYVVYATLCAAATGSGDVVSAVIGAVAEACAAFGGVCTLSLTGKAFIPADSENSADSEDVKVPSSRAGKAFVVNAFCAFICAALLFGGNLLYSAFVYGSDAAPHLPLGLSIPLMGIVVPISEEIFFRGHLLTHLTSRGVSRTVSVVTSSAAFALIHDLRIMPFAFFAGLCLGWCSVICGKRGYLASFAAHGIYNTALLIIANVV
ncbi:MAG: CPBP family intramembrane metalloprotease [Clostridia bacterium]|nr:CPBP family intramembrane metalloprotease [Clostridia bacterium]